MFISSRALLAPAVLGLALVSGCGAATSQVRGGRAAQAPYSEEVLTDPMARLQAMQQMRTQILRKTGRIEEARFAGSVRPSLAGQLVRAGFTATEAEHVLAWVDEARADHARVSAWWSSLTTEAPTPSLTHSMR